DLRTGKVFAVASVISHAPVGPSYEATPVTLIRRLLSSYMHEEPDVTDRPENLKEAAPPPPPAKPPSAQGSSNFNLASFDVIYFSRPRDRGIVEELLNKQKIKWR